ncbi:MAG: NADH-quinone oxidoreductase subunit N [Spirochaetes bacterium]|nr:NADH-quinone oxidoreductase subunit N [Spirochaetota bacterium]
MDYSLYLGQLKYLIPEAIVLVFALAAMIVHLFAKINGRRAAGILSIIGLVAAGISLIYSPLAAGEIYSETLSVDQFALYFKIIFLISGILAILLSFKFFDVEKSEPGEAYYLILLSIVGMMFAVSSVDFISFYVSFELFAILSYILAGIFKKDKRSAEAGVKYFILGTLSSALMVLGMAILVGVSGSTTYTEIAAMLADGNSKIELTGMLLLFSGLFFKLALAPFHMWTPDVYEGAPTPLVVFLSTAPKAAVFAVIIRMIYVMFGGFEMQWQIIFQVIAVITMFWGNIAALTQKNIKRMMAYSSIAHAGYIMMGLAAFGTKGNMAMMFYLFVYLFMNAAAFGLILLVQKNNGFGEYIDDMRGFARKSPLMAGGIIVLLLSLTGIPPTAGFMGKYFLFTAVVEKGMYVLAVIGALNSVISLFYYFQIGRAMFMEEAGVVEIIKDKSYYARSVITVSVIVILVIGILPGTLTKFASLSSLIK